MTLDLMQELVKKWKEKSKALEKAKTELFLAQKKLGQAIAKEKGFPDGAAISTEWGCKTSPTGFCVYDLSGGSSCIYCGEPEERK